MGNNSLFFSFRCPEYGLVTALHAHILKSFLNFHLWSHIYSCHTFRGDFCLLCGTGTITTRTSVHAALFPAKNIGLFLPAHLADTWGFQISMFPSWWMSPKAKSPCYLSMCSHSSSPLYGLTMFRKATDLILSWFTRRSIAYICLLFLLCFERRMLQESEGLCHHPNELIAHPVSKPPASQLAPVPLKSNSCYHFFHHPFLLLT